MARKRAAPPEVKEASRKRTKPLASDASTSAPALPKSSVKRKLVHNAAPSFPFKVFTFGEGTAGELGFGNVNGAAQAKVPRPNHKLENVVAITAGGMHGVALDAKGLVITWGCNDEYALGRDTPPEEESEEGDDDLPGLNFCEATPTNLSFLPRERRIVQVAAGDSCTFALTDDGHVYGWGTFRNKNGAYGFTLDQATGHRTKYQKTPMLIPDLQRIVKICAGADFALALDADGRLFGWGPNESGETGHRLLGRHHHPDETLLPHLVALPRAKFVSVHCGLNHAFAINAAGHVWAWGLNNYGQTGIHSGAGSNDPIIKIPQRVRSLPAMKAIEGGAHHSVGLAEDGRCIVWGRIDGFQTGLPVAGLADRPDSEVAFDEAGKPRILLQPLSLPIPSCTRIAVGTDHSIAVTAAGKAYSWGLNTSAQCGQGSEDDVEEAKPIAAKTVKEEKISFAIAGGQFSMIASMAGT